jgi:hypothetical protein
MDVSRRIYPTSLLHPRRRELKETSLKYFIAGSRRRFRCGTGVATQQIQIVGRHWIIVSRAEGECRNSSERVSKKIVKKN